MENLSSDKGLENIDDNIIPELIYGAMKIELDKNAFIGPCFNYFIYKMKESEKNEIKDNESSSISSKKNSSLFDIEEIEQIDEVKTNMFFVLYNNADYNQEYDSIIKKGQNFMLKRIVYQDYSINENEIKFERKQYIFIPIKTGNNCIKFTDKDNNVITVEKKKKNEEKEKNKKGIIMKINDNNIKNVDEFIQENSTIKNKEELNYKKCSEPKSVENMKIENNEINNSLSENKNMILTDTNTISFTDSNKLSSLSNSTIKDDSEKELKGEIFYGNNRRYIYLDRYEKQIDGVFSRHKKINLIKDKINLEDGLNALLLDEYNINNDIQSHIIFKNFEKSQIDENASFIIEVKKSMAELTDLLRQIKEITKVVRNLNCDIQLPKNIIGIICSYNKDQVKFQMQKLKLKYKGGIFLNHVMDIINDKNINNKINVVIGAIKDETILNYNLGQEDFENGFETRIDINYMNSLFKKLEEEKMINIFNKYREKYISLTYKKYTKDNYDTLNNSYKNMLNDFNRVKKEKKKTEDENKKLNEEKKKTEDEIKKLKEKIKELEKKINK